MKNTILYSLFLIASTASITWYIAQYSLNQNTTDNPTNNPAKTTSELATIPQTDCEIRTWYNYQVIAIPYLNDNWIKQGFTLEQRAQKAYLLRHEARLNARFMMKDKQAVELLNQRDIEKYGNPNGPTFEYLVNKFKTEGKTQDEIFEAIIESAGKTDTKFNAACD